MDAPCDKGRTAFVNPQPQFHTLQGEEWTPVVRWVRSAGGAVMLPGGAAARLILVKKGASEPWELQTSGCREGSPKGQPQQAD